MPGIHLAGLPFPSCNRRRLDLGPWWVAYQYFASTHPASFLIALQQLCTIIAFLLHYCLYLQSRTSSRFHEIRPVRLKVVCNCVWTSHWPATKKIRCMTTFFSMVYNTAAICIFNNWCVMLCFACEFNWCYAMFRLRGNVSLQSPLCVCYQNGSLGKTCGTSLSKRTRVR